MVMIPIQTQFFAMRGMSKLIEVVELVKRRLNPVLRLSAIIPGVNIPEQLEVNVRGSYERDLPKSPEDEQAMRECRRNYYAHLTPDYRWLHQWQYV